MGFIRFSFLIDHRIPIEFIEFLGMGIEIGRGKHRLIGDTVFVLDVI